MFTDERNEIFIRLVQILRDNSDMVELVRKMSGSDEFHRNLLIVEVTTQMKQSGETESVIEAVKLLNEPGVLTKINEIITNNEHKKE